MKTHKKVYTGYCDCACRDCFEIAIGRVGEAVCLFCEEAGCKGGDNECEAETAYGVDSTEQAQ